MKKRTGRSRVARRKGQTVARPPAETQPVDEELSLIEATRREAVAKARLREIELAQTEGRLLDGEGVKAAWVQVADSIKNSMLGIPARVAQHLSTISNPREVQGVLDAEIRKTLTVLADGGLPAE